MGVTEDLKETSSLCRFMLIAVNVFCLSILFSQYRWCDDSQESIFFQSWTFSRSYAVFLMNTPKVQTSWGSSHDLYWENKKVCCCNKSYLESHSALCLNFTERKISDIRCFLKTIWNRALGNPSFIWLKGKARNWRQEGPRNACSRFVYLRIILWKIKINLKPSEA